MISGIPIVFRGNALAAGGAIVIGNQRTAWMRLRNKGANIVRVYFSAADLAADANYLELPVAAAITPHGEWEGPVDLPFTKDVGYAIWAKAASADTAIEVVIITHKSR